MFPIYLHSQLNAFCIKIKKTRALVRIMNYRLLFVFIILIIDFIYVYTSQSVYNNILHFADFPIKRKIIGIIGAYTFMAIGWYFLIGPKIEQLMRKEINVNPIKIGFWCGFLYAALVYGVYNFTMYATIKNWEGNIMMRDLIWGFSSAILLSIGYSVFIKLVY